MTVSPACSYAEISAYGYQHCLLRLGNFPLSLINHVWKIPHVATRPPCLLPCLPAEMGKFPHLASHRGQCWYYQRWPPPPALVLTWSACANVAQAETLLNALTWSSCANVAQVEILLNALTWSSCL